MLGLKKSLCLFESFCFYANHFLFTPRRFSLYSGLFRQDARPSPSQFEGCQTFRRSRRRKSSDTMSHLDMMHHQSYDAHRYLPAKSAALAYRAAYFHREQQQLWKLSSFCRLQGTGDEFAQRTQLLASDPEGMKRGGGEEEGRGEGEDSIESGPTKAEYLSSGCVLFTYFQGTIGAEVDEHFSRALREGGAMPSAQQCGSSSPAHPFSPGSSLCLSSLQPELSLSCKIQAPEPALSGSITHEAPDSWHHTPGTQSGALYQHVHEMHPHMQSHHVHPHVHARYFFSPTPRIHFSARIGGHL